MWFFKGENIPMKNSSRTHEAYRVHSCCVSIIKIVFLLLYCQHYSNVTSYQRKCIEFYKFWTFCVVDFTKYGVWNVDLRIWFKYINIYTQRSIEKMHQSHVDNKKRLLLGSILQIYCYRLNFAGTGAVMVPVCHLNLNLAVEST